jgi:hypothetical protein
VTGVHTNSWTPPAGCIVTIVVLLLDWEKESTKAQDILIMGQMEEGDVVTQLVEVRSHLPLVTA